MLRRTAQQRAVLHVPSGVDYISVSQSVTFAPGETTQGVNVVICGDTLVEPTQTVNLT
ncbi:MAG: hypothetical protein IPL32_00030 [Chloracidobacterium sp.]|nr:hypothetical protein [Chloracidobacterium sp.]